MFCACSSRHSQWTGPFNGSNPPQQLTRPSIAACGKTSKQSAFPFKPKVPGADAQRNYPQCWTAESQLQNSNVNVEGWRWLTAGSTIQKCLAASNASGSVSFSQSERCTGREKVSRVHWTVWGDCAKDSKENVNPGNTWIETSQLNKQSAKDTMPFMEVWCAYCI